jgi:hypothetical protein
MQEKCMYYLGFILIDATHTTYSPHQSASIKMVRKEYKLRISMLFMSASDPC